MSATRSNPAAWFALSLLLSSASACDDAKKSEVKSGEPQSVAEGAKPETAAGKAVERGKVQIEAAENQMQVRDDQIHDAAKGEKNVGRGQIP